MPQLLVVVVSLVGLVDIKPLRGPRQHDGIPVDFIRHGSTKFNTTVGDVPPKGSADRIRGHLDIPLDDRGREEAKKAGKKLCNGGPDFLVSSDLRRASETAHIISSICGIPVKGYSQALRPWDLGVLQGQESAKVAPQIAHYAKNPDKTVPRGESFHQFANRFIGGLKQILSTPQRVGVIAHHRNERLLKAIEKTNWNGVDMEEFLRHDGANPGGFTTFKIPPQWLSK